jgi:predicted HTH domain antitoxin
MKREQMVGSRLSAELMRDLELIERVEESDRSTVVRKLLQRAARDWKMEYYSGQYAEGRVSTAQAAEACGVSLWEMMEYFRQHKVPSQYDREEWEQDLLTLQRRAASKPI